MENTVIEGASLVLVVDDDPMVRVLVGETLRQIGLIVEEVETGTAALEFIDRSQPDVILLDVLMPGMSGFDACTAIRAMEQGRHIPIMMMTGLDDIDSIDHAFEVGATDFITKPLNYAILGHRVRYLLRTMQAFESVRQSKKAIHHLAYYDALTNLPNRRMFTERLHQALEMARRNNGLMGVLFIDIDNFKRINDSFGHSVGDRLLRSVAGQLLTCLRRSDAVARDLEEDARVARLGGDEFTVMLGKIDQAEDAARVARRIIDAIAVPFLIGTEEVVVTPSIGIAVFPYDGDSVEELIRTADTAMFNAKQHGKNNFEFYTHSMSTAVLERLAMDNSLRKALSDNEFEVYYQPKISLLTREVTGLETLLRWRHPDKGIIMPNDFIPAAEDTGLIVPIGEWALRSACIQLRRWADAGLTPMRMAVNLSACQFRQSMFCQMVERCLDEAGIPPGWLELELTESIIMDDIQNSSQVLRELKQMGVQVSLDDFGTGYSSLGLLKRLPIATLKIDNSFVRNIGSDADDAAIVEAVITLAHSLRLSVIAEGVETLDQLEFLSERQCDEAQGYYFTRALPAPEMEQWLRDNGAFSAVKTVRKPAG
jgi:diguanylate cyclase (GGDEF)-like protein